MSQPVHPDILQSIKKVTGKRPRTVIEHILKYGFITTEQLKGDYGYDHPPRAARDVREAGIPLDTFYVRGKNGRKIAAYRFGDPLKIEAHKLAGRKIFSKEFGEELYTANAGLCATCCSRYEKRYLQIDHRIPYEVVGDNVGKESNPLAFMLLCGSCQRKKSWTCESCVNWKTTRNPATCKTCYWGSPETYEHIALSPIRRIELVWTEKEVATFNKLVNLAQKVSKQPAELIHAWIRAGLENEARR